MRSESGRVRMRAVPALLAAAALSIPLADSLASTVRWEPYPPGVGGPWGGAVRQLVSPGDPANLADPDWNTLWAATSGGAYRSQDGGVSWSLRNGTPAGGPLALESLDVADVDVCRANPSRVVASTGLLTSTAAPARAVYLSSDGGGAWIAVLRSFRPQGGGLRNRFPRVAIDPADCSHLFVAAFDDGETNGNLLESRDAGATWTDRGSYAVATFRFESGGSLLFATRDGVLYRYGGAASPSAFVFAFPEASPVIQLDANGTTIAAAQGGGGMWVSRDSGAQWQELYFRGFTNRDFLEIDAAALDPGAPRVTYHVNDPLFDQYTAACELELAPPADQVIRYTIDGSDPSPGSSLYTTPLAIAAPTTLKFRSYRGTTAGPVVAQRYEIGSGAPLVQAEPAGGVFHPRCSYPATVTLRAPSAVTGLRIYLTLDGTEPTLDGVNPSLTALSYAAPIALSWSPAKPFPQTTTVKFYAVTPAGEGSGVFTEQYVFAEGAPTVTASVGSGRYASPQSVSLDARWVQALPLPEDGMEVWTFCQTPACEWMGENKAGVFRRDGRAGPFVHSSRGLAAYTARDVAFSPAGDGSFAVAGGQQSQSGNGGLYLWQPVSGAWERVAARPEDPVTGTLPAESTNLVAWRAPGELWVGVEARGLYRRTSPSAPWEERFLGMGEFARSVVGSLAFSPSDPRVALAGTLSGVYRTSAADRAWASNETPPPWTAVPDAAIPQEQDWRVAVDRRAPLAFYAGGRDAGSGLFVQSGDGGATWVAPALCDPNVEPCPFDGKQIVVLAASESTDGYVLAGTRISGVLASTDGGETWAPAGDGTNGMPASGAVTALAVRNQPNDPEMAAALNGSLYLTLDGGNRWLPVGDGLALPSGNTPRVNALRFQPSGARLVAAVQDRGLWYLDLFPTASLPDAPVGFSPLRNPNLTVAGSEVVAYKYSLDGSAYSLEAPVSAPLSLAGLDDGSHTVAAVGRNTVGAWQPIGQATTATWTVDGTPPTTGSVVAAGGAGATASPAVALALSATDALAGVSQMRLANDAPPVGAAGWEPYQTSRTWTLSPGDGAKIVYAQFRDAAGNESVPANDTILLDTTAPIGATVTINGGAAEATSTDVALDLSASDGAGSGLSEMRFSNDGTNWAAWMPFAAATPWTLQTGSGTGMRTVHAQFRDGVGNVSATATDDILLVTPDLTPPSGTVAIDGDAAFTNTSSVGLSLSAADDRGGPVEMCLGNDPGPCTAWEPFATNKTWTLTAGDGTKTVYVRFRDGMGNVSALVSDDIVLDTLPPSVSIAAVLTPTNRDVQQIGGTAEAGAVVAVTVDTGAAVGSIARPTPTTWTSSVTGLVLGANTLTATATDAAGNAAQAQAQIARIANRPPAPTSDALALDEDTSGTSQVQPNDPDGLDTHTYAVETPPARGTVSVSATGLVSYAPDADYHGPDAVVVRVTDTLGGSATTTLDISVAPVNDAPSARAGTLTTAEDAAGSGSVVATDVDGDPLTYSLATGPSLGSVSLDPVTGAYTYTPLPNANGSDSFTFRANDGTADSAAAAVAVTVTPVNDPPTVSVEPLVLDEDTPGTAQVQVSDPDAGDGHTYAITAPPARGVATVSGTGLVRYAPTDNDHGSYSLTIEVRDAAGASATVILGITVVSVNDAPVLGLIGGKSVTEEESLAFTVSGTDADGDSLVYAVSGLPAGASFDAATGDFAWSPAGGQAGSYSVTFTVSDSQAQDSETVSISVAPLSVAPPSSEGGGGGGGCFLSIVGD